MGYLTVRDSCSCVPGVEAGDAERLEVFNVPRHNGHISRLCDGGNEGVVEWRVLGDAVRGKHSRGREVEWQHTISERRQDMVFEPAAQDCALSSVG